VKLSSSIRRFRPATVNELANNKWKNIAIMITSKINKNIEKIGGKTFPPLLNTAEYTYFSIQ